MFLKLLTKIGRKKIVLDRGPSHPKFNEAKPWMNRYYVLFRHRPRWFPFNILIHEMLDDDHGDGVHNHLFPFITIILKDGYWETLKSGKFWRPPGYIGFRSANTFHRVDLKPGTKPITIFISGPFGLRKGPRSRYGVNFKKKMKQKFFNLNINTTGHRLYEFTDQTINWIEKSNFKNGILNISIQHTSASLIVQENADPDVQKDLLNYFDKLVPMDNKLYIHTLEGKDDMPAHIKSALTNNQISLSIKNSKLLLGTWQGLYLFEHRIKSQNRILIHHFIGE